MGTVLSDPKLMNQAASQATPDLNDFTYYNNRSYGGISPEEINSDRAQGMLTNLQKYDPNAQFTPVHTSDGDLMGYQLQFDPSKLPGVAQGSGPLGGSNPSSNGSYSGGSGYMPKFSTVQSNMNLSNPNAVGMSDHYGKVTDNRNIYDKPALLDTLGPLAVGGFGLLAGGGGALASLLQKAPQMAEGIQNGQFNPMSLASIAAPFIPGASSVMPYLGAANMAYQVSQGNFNPIQLALAAGKTIGGK